MLSSHITAEIHLVAQPVGDMYLVTAMAFTIFGLWVMTYVGIKKLLTWRENI